MKSEVESEQWTCRYAPAAGTNPSQEGYYNRNNPLVKGVPPHIQRPSPARWRLVNMWGRPFYQGIISVITWVPPHIQVPRIFRCLRPGPHLFPCSSMHWTTVFCIEITRRNVCNFEKRKMFQDCCPGVQKIWSCPKAWLGQTKVFRQKAHILQCSFYGKVQNILIQTRIIFKHCPNIN